MQNEIYRHRESRLPIVYGGARFTTGDGTLKANVHFVDGCGD
jgi:hypothetical protein